MIYPSTSLFMGFSIKRDFMKATVRPRYDQERTCPRCGGVMYAASRLCKGCHDEAAIFKGQGVKAGVPDVMILTPSRTMGTSGVAIELKSAKGRLSEAQKDWATRLTRCNWSWYVCASMDEVVEVLRAHGYCR